MLDYDLAQLYETETKRLNEAVKRNIGRFPSDFMFRLTVEEWEHMRSQIATASPEDMPEFLRSQIATLETMRSQIVTASPDNDPEFLRSQFVTLEDGRGKFSKYLPYAFTEQGVAMLSSVLKSQKAIEVNIAIMRAFVFIRQYALSHKDLTEKLKELETKYDTQFSDVYQALSYLFEKDKQETEQTERKRIGYKP
jgi:hypothetical protein